MSEKELGVYEMLWDCHYCGTKKLLGKTHRHCPNCGAQQDPSLRYFPSDADKVAVADHVYYGADRLCPACKAPMSAKANNCANCGSPLEGAKEVQKRSDQVQAPGQAFAAETEKDAKQDLAAAPGAKPGPQAPKDKPKKKKGRGCLIALGIAVVLLIVAVILFAWEKPITITASGHAWSREIQIESFATRTDSAWCDSMPSEAFDVSRSREVRSHKQVADGQDCRTKRVDRGNGTFSEKQECKTKYRSEPVYDDKCRFKVNRWGVDRSVKDEGTSLAKPPAWPAFTLKATGQCLGCEREGKHLEDYTVTFLDAQGNKNECRYDQAKWGSIPDNSKWTTNIGVVTKILDCNTLKPAK